LEKHLTLERIFVARMALIFITRLGNLNNQRRDNDEGTCGMSIGEGVETDKTD
jgi:hypothetical protein